MLKGLSGLPARCLQLGLSCTGEPPLGKDPAGLGSEESREGKGDRRLVCMDETWR